MKTYKAIFFDLDHTLWDFEMNSELAITEIYHEHKLDTLGIPGVIEFFSAYRDINKNMWDQYHRNTISKEFLRSGRFNQTLENFGISNMKLADVLAGDYLRSCPIKTNLFPGTLDTLEYLAKKYSLHIITNGFREVQYLKIRHSGLEPFFKHIHISEEIGYKKPEPEIFHYAVQKSGTVRDHCIMIGDNMDTDICGAENAGIDPVLFNPHKIKLNRKVLHEINTIDQLKNII